ncbi:hypothetical protein [Rhodococcus sp. NCIMB 12038]|nr:hypothetical protein [Rhodococcus sp. NCIMB 12038]
MADAALTPLENNALNWVVLCERLKLDPSSTSVLDVLRLVESSK